MGVVDAVPHDSAEAEAAAEASSRKRTLPQSAAGSATAAAAAAPDAAGADRGKVRRQSHKADEVGDVEDSSEPCRRSPRLRETPLEVLASQTGAALTIVHHPPEENSKRRRKGDAIYES